MEYSEYDKAVMPALLLGIVAASVILAVLLRNKRERLRNIPFVFLAILLLLLEIIKQMNNLRGEFSYFALPFHYCSLFLITIPSAELFGKKASSFFRPLAMCTSFIVSVGMYIFPSGILGDASELFGKEFSPTHSLLFHSLVAFYFVLNVAMNRYRPKKKDSIFMLFMGIVYVAVVIPLSYRLDTNYANLLESVIPPLETFRVEHGQIPYTVIIIAAHTLGASICSLIYYYLYHSIARMHQKINISPNKKEKRR